VFGGTLSPKVEILQLTDERKAQFIAAAVVAGSNFTMVLTQWHTYMYFLAISFFAIGLNIFGYRFLGRWNEGACASAPMCSSPDGF
jgi:hypothetical protein